MDPIGFTLAIVAEARALGARLRNFRQNPEKFTIAIESLESLDKHIADVIKILNESPDAVPEKIRNSFNRILSDVKRSLSKCTVLLDASSQTAGAGNSSSLARKFVSSVIRLGRANKTASLVTEIQAETKEASNSMQNLLGIVANSLSLSSQLQSQSISSTRAQTYRPGDNAPVLPANIRLDFDSRGDDDRFMTPEGALKSQIRMSSSSSGVTAATGSRSVHGALGMAGVGKTIALIGLASDQDIRHQFADGVWYMSFGIDATEQHVIRELVMIMEASGATSSAEIVKSLTSLQEAVVKVALWFQGKVCLFLVDDIWPIAGGFATGYLGDIQQLLRGSPGSRMAVSSRSHVVALAAGSYVDFGARDALGVVSVRIFKAPMAVGTQSDVLIESEKAILKLCAGLPIALAMAGLSVAKLISFGLNYEDACEQYAADLRDGREKLTAAHGYGKHTLYAGITISLRYLTVELEKAGKSSSLCANFSIAEMYSSLCVLRNQQWVPLSVLSLMWRSDIQSSKQIVGLFCSVSLAKMSRRQGEVGLQLHDLQLEFCKEHAIENESTATWHSRLLDGHLEYEDDACDNKSGLEGKISQEAAYAPRQWWSHSTPNKEYICVNVTRHLCGAGLDTELGALVLDLRWLNCQARYGGFLAIKNDFAVLDQVLSKSQYESAKSISKATALIMRAIEMGAGHISDGVRAFGFLLSSRLCTAKTKSAFLSTFLLNAKRATPRPVLVPVNDFASLSRNGLTAEYCLGEICWFMSHSTCSRFIAVASWSDVVVLDASSRQILKRLVGHTSPVKCMSFGKTPAEVISGSEDGTVKVWEWEKGVCVTPVRNGISGYIRQVLMSSDGMPLCVALGDKTAEVSDLGTGEQIRTISSNMSICAVTVCPRGKFIVLGLVDQTLKVYDVRTEEKCAVFETVHRSCIVTAAFSRDGHLLASGCLDGSVCLWDAQQWQNVGNSLEGHTKIVMCISFTPDGKQFVSGSYDGTLRLLNAEDGRCVGVSRAQVSPVQSVSFGEGGKEVVSGSYDGFVRVWNAADLWCERNEIVDEHSDTVTCVAISPDGSRIASGSWDKTILVWDAKTGALLGTPLEGHMDRVECAAFSADATRLVSGSLDGTLRLWDTSTCAQLGDAFEGHAEWVRCVSFTRDEKRIISEGRDQTVRIWDCATQLQIGEPMVGHSDVVTSVAESPDGSCLVSRGKNETIIWDSQSRAVLWRSDTDRSEAQSTLSTQEAAEIISSSFPPPAIDLDCTGTTVCFGSSDPKTILGRLTRTVPYWSYNAQKQILTARQDSRVAICYLEIE